MHLVMTPQSRTAGLNHALFSVVLAMTTTTGTTAMDPEMPNGDSLLIDHHHDDDVQPQKVDSWHIADFGHVPEQSRDGSPHATDEVFNAASHLAATFLSILGTVLLIVQSTPNPWKIVSFSIYGASLIFLFGASTLHHALVGNVEEILRKLDYLAIYPLIAGTFTPPCLVFYHNSGIGWTFCMTVWGIAILSMVTMSMYFHKIPRWLSMTTYITLGWFGACMTYWLWPVLGPGGFFLFLIGGIFYTGGGYIFMTERPNPVPGKFGFHEIWHVAVILGALSHYCLMYFYVLPYEKK